MSLLAPLGLLALAALALPLWIHRMRRPPGPPVDFAAMRWIGLEHTPTSRRQLQQWLLLALRCALLGLIALLMAWPVRHVNTEAVDWILLAPGVDPALATATIDAGNAQWHWLAPGFPPLDGRPPDRAAGDHFSLIREVDSERPPTARLTIVVPEELGGLDGERPSLGREVRWRVLPGRSPETASSTPDRAPAAAVEPRRGTETRAADTRPLAPLLAVAAALLFLLERYWATRRRSRAA